jgi:uncharacterized Zn finger protein
MKDENTYNEEFLEAQREDFYQFLAETDWKNAQAIVDNLYELGATLEATYLRKALLNAQNDYLDENEVEAVFFAQKDNPLNGIQVEGETSELNPNRGEASY